MKITRLSPDRIKVFLSASDLLDRDIKNLSPTSPQLSSFLGDILAIVQKETGFSLEVGQVLAEAFSARDGIELMLSHPKPTKNSSLRTSCVAFEFADAGSLLGAIMAIPHSYLAAMRLYAMGGKFYLSTPRKKVPPQIYEFSFRNYASHLAESFLCEHAEFLADGYRLLCIAFGIKKIN